MTIGLLRHFKVDFVPRKKIYSASDFSNAMEKYESSPVIRKDIKLNSDEWDVCYSSTIPRAVETAKSIYNKEIIFTNHIIEVPVAPFTNRNIKLPSFIWHLGGRIAWHKNHRSQPEKRIETLERIRRFIEELKQHNYERVLVVTHGFFMRVFVEQLIKIGYRGAIDVRPQNAKLYLFQKRNAGV
ncbi:MAG: histidine phosphatase family protein [Melioribacteraceae bacterium]|nr:histidine phosphatase family protein [Melioribacteraceae bacterium]